MLQLATLSNACCLPAENTRACTHTHTNTHGRAHSHTYSRPLPHCSPEARKMLRRHTRAGQRSLSLHSRGKVTALPAPFLPPPHSCTLRTVTAGCSGRTPCKNLSITSVQSGADWDAHPAPAPLSPSTHAACIPVSSCRSPPDSGATLRLLPEPSGREPPLILAEYAEAARCAAVA